MALRYLAILSFLLVMMHSGRQAVFGQSIDPHDLYEHHCSGCHATHAGEFVHASLERPGDRLVGQKTGKDRRSFLEQGHGKLAPQEIDVIIVHLTSILNAGAVFRDQCFVCHGRAVELARAQLTLRGSRLVGRYTGRDIATFLETHGRLEGGQAEVVIRMLERQLTTRNFN